MREGIGRTDATIIRSKMNDGRDIILRTIRPDDAELLRAGIASLSTNSRYLRFFSPAPMVPDAVVNQLVDVDGVDHIAWGAICVDCDVETAVGAVHSMRNKIGSRAAEYSVTVADAYHGQGIARMLTAALLVDCLAAGITTLDVYILSENHAALSLVKSMGAIHKISSIGVSDYILDVETALDALRKEGIEGVQLVLAQLEAAG